MSGIQNNTSSGPQTSPAFWAWHPFGRGIGTGIVTVLFTTTPFYSGGLYGGISGLANIAFRPIFTKINETTASPQVKAINYLFSATLPWAASATVMHQVYKASGNTLFRMSPTTALGTACAVEFFAYANTDLLEGSS